MSGPARSVQFFQEMEQVVCCVCTKEILKSVRRKCGGCNEDMHGSSCGDDQMVGTLKKDKTGLCFTCKEAAQKRTAALSEMPVKSKQKAAKKSSSLTPVQPPEIVVLKFASPSLTENPRLQDMCRLAFALNEICPGSNMRFIEKRTPTDLWSTRIHKTIAIFLVFSLNCSQF